MYISCDACGEEISSKDCGCSEKARKRAKAQYDRINELENRLDDISNAVMIAIDDIAQRKLQNGDHRHYISSEVMSQLWQSANCCWREVKSSDNFLSRELIRGGILLDVMDLFRKVPTRWKKTANEIVSFKDRLTHIRDGLSKYYQFCGWKESIDLTTDEVIKGIKNS